MVDQEKQEPVEVPDEECQELIETCEGVLFEHNTTEFNIHIRRFGIISIFFLPETK